MAHPDLDALPRRAPARVPARVLREVTGLILVIAGVVGAVTALAAHGHGLAAILTACAAAAVTGVALCVRW